MIKRRAAAADLPPGTCCHTFRATGITAYLSNGGTLEQHRNSPRMPPPRRRNSTTAPRIPSLLMRLNGSRFSRAPHATRPLLLKIAAAAKELADVVTRHGGEKLQYDASYYSQTPGLTSQPVVRPVPGGPTVAFSRASNRPACATVLHLFKLISPSNVPVPVALPVAKSI